MGVCPRTDVRSAVVAGLVAGYGIAMPVGAISVYLLSLSARTQWRTAAAGALGVATVDALYAGTAVVGGRALAGAIEPLANACRVAAAAGLLCIAGRTALHGLDQYRLKRSGTNDLPPNSSMSARRGYVALCAMTCLNPTTLAYFLAIVVGRSASSSTGVPAKAMFVVAAFAASASWQLVLASAGRLLGRTFTGPKGRLATSTASALIIATLAAAMLT